MKTLWMLLLGCSLSAPGWSQGQIFFSNRVSMLLNGVPFAFVDAPIFDVDCTTRLEGASFVAQLYVGLEPNSLAPFGPTSNFRTGDRAGYFQPWILTFPSELTGIKMYVQVRVWEVAAGSTFEAAFSRGGKYGVSNLLRLTAIPPPGTPNDLIGLQSFCLVPEPSPGVLLVLGGAGLLALARRRRIRAAPGGVCC